MSEARRVVNGAISEVVSASIIASELFLEVVAEHGIFSMHLVRLQTFPMIAEQLEFVFSEKEVHGQSRFAD
jgi:hypothetical protein